MAQSLRQDLALCDGPTTRYGGAGCCAPRRLAPRQIALQTTGGQRIGIVGLTGRLAEVDRCKDNLVALGCKGEHATRDAT